LRPKDSPFPTRPRTNRNESNHRRADIHLLTLTTLHERKPTKMAGLFFSEALLKSGWARDVRLNVVDGLISSVETAVRPAADDERHGIGLPGMPNLHSHAFQRAMAGLTEFRAAGEDTFWTWRERMYHLALAMSPEDMQAVAALAYVEMLEAGFTRVGEFHYLHHDRDGKSYGDPAEMALRIMAAADQTGLGLTLLPVFYAHGGFGGKPPLPNQLRFICDPESYAALVNACRRAGAGHRGWVVGIAAHSLRAVTPAELASVQALAADGPIHIHAAEQVREVEDCLAWSGQRPVEWLLDYVAPDRRWCIIHATHMTVQETERLAGAGVVVGLCPVTEANLGDGMFPGADYTSCGGRFGIGSDSNVLIAVADELRQLEYSQRLKRQQRNLMNRGEGSSTGRSLYETALEGGALALGGQPPGLASGAAADIVSLNPEHPALLERHGDQLLDAWIFAAASCPVDCVWVGGRKWVRGGRHLRREAILDEYRKSLIQLAES
jgi:formimidoylglutamate deiminase